MPRHLSIAESVSCCCYNPFRALLPHQPKGLGDAERFCSDVTFLLVLTEEGAVEDRVYSLSMVWVNPYQAQVSTMEEAVKQLTTQDFTGPHWPYTLVHLNGDACHMPLPREGYLSVLVEGGIISTTSGRVSQLEVCQLLSSGSQVIYLVGLNGCEVPVIASLPESLAKGANLLGGEPIYLKVDILQCIVEGPKLKVPLPWQSIFPPECESHQGSPTKGRRRGQHDHGSEGAPILGGIRYIWTCIREFHPKKARACGPGTGHTSAHQTRRFPLASGYVIPGEHPRQC